MKIKRSDEFLFVCHPEKKFYVNKLRSSLLEYLQTGLFCPQGSPNVFTRSFFQKFFSVVFLTS